MLKIHQHNGGFSEIKRRKLKKKSNRKRGRPRKKHELKPLKPSRKQPYSIILTSRSKQKECIKTFRTEEEAYQYFSNLLESNKKVIFPIKYLNYKGIVDAKYELYILKRINEYDVKNTVMLRDNLGKFIEYDTDSDKWQIIDKADWNIEETFWVNGYDPKYQRKTFQWIFDNFIGIDCKNKYLFKNILLYNNKLIIDSVESTEIIFCKCINDAFRLYNEIEELCIKERMKNIMFSGNLRDYSKSTISSWIDKLCDVTGFNRTKIKRNSLRP